MAAWMYNRLPDQPDPHFAFTGTAHWMRALAILAEPNCLTDQVIAKTYAKVQRRSPQPDRDTDAYGYLLMALHNMSALTEFNRHSARSRYNTIRSAIVAWYYVVYECCSAAVLAQSGDSAEEHRSTARIWHKQVAQPGLICDPFGYYLDTLVEKPMKAEVTRLRSGSTHDLTNKPMTKAEARGALLSYLKGTAEYERERVENRVRGSKEFKALNVSTFRTKAARQLRDAALAKGQVNFLIQAFRYRGKANYRDSIYLSYGNDWTLTVAQLSEDLETVARAFFRVTAALVKKRTEAGTWDDFVDDIHKNFRPEFDAGLVAK